MAESTRETIFRLRGLLPLPLLFITIVWARPTLDLLLYGGALVVAGELIRLWAAGYIRVYRVTAVATPTLVTAGPYAHVRNPLYWGNFLIGFGFTVMSGWWVAYLLFLATYLGMYGAIVPLEEEYLEKTFGADYAAYKEKVRRFRPTLRPYDGASGSFSLRAAFGGEWRTMVTHAMVAALFVLRALVGSYLH